MRIPALMMAMIALLGLPALASAATPADATQTAVLAGGCFWGVEGVFERVRGVKRVVSGYAGGEEKTAKYRAVGTGQTGHAEAVQITFDPAVVSYGELLRIFFSVAHDPTQLNRQGPDVGSQYRSVVFYANDAQRNLATLVHRRARQVRQVPARDRDARGPAAGFLSGGERTPGFHREESGQCLRRVPRPAQDPESQAALSRELSRGELTITPAKRPRSAKSSTGPLPTPKCARFTAY